MANIFGVTAAQVAAKMNSLGEALLVTLDVTGGPGTAAVQGIADELADRVVSAIPEKYRRMLRRVEGEVLIADASGGETSASLSLAPVSDADVWLNPLAGATGLGDRPGYSSLDYPGGADGMAMLAWGREHGGPLPYSARSRASCLLADVDYSLDSESGALTLVRALSAGDMLVADYSHTGASSCLALVNLTLNLAVAELAQDLPWTDPARRVEFVRERRELAREHFRGMWGADGSNFGVDPLDRLRLVEETRTTDACGRLPVTGAW